MADYYTQYSAAIDNLTNDDDCPRLHCRSAVVKSERQGKGRS